jgi:YVTN family beta-propeller protein
MRATKRGSIIAALVAVLATSGTVVAAPFAYVAGSAPVQVIDLATNQVVGSPIPIANNPRAVAVSTDGLRAYIGRQTAAFVSVLDTTTNTVIADIPIPTGAGLRGVAVNAARTRVYTTNQDLDSVTVIDATTNTVIGTPITVGDRPDGIAVHPNGTRVYAGNQGNGTAASRTVTVIDAATNAVVATIPMPGIPRGIVVRPDGGRVYVAIQGSTGSVVPIDPVSNTVAGAAITTGSNTVGLAINAAATRLYAGNFGAATVSVIDLTTNTVIATPATGNQPFGISVHPDGSRFYVMCNSSDRVDVFNASTNAFITSVAVGSFPISYGQFIVPGANDGIFANGYE